MYKYEQALAASKEYFGGEELPANIVVGKYLLKNDDMDLLELTPDDKHKRIAKELARIEAGKFKTPYTEEEIYGWLKNYGKIVPQGSPMYGIGNKSQYVTLSNCYVLESQEADSYGGIHYLDEQISQISKRRGGVGLDISHIRPEGMLTKNSSHTTTGIIPFMERFSNSIREVGQGNRRGAMMMTISCHHPQVLDFARVKLDKTKVTGANISIRLSNEFLLAVENDAEYEQRWPVNLPNPVVSKKVKARDVWKEIIKCAHTMAEPGLLFWDNVLNESPADCYAKYGFRSVSTNPCSELPLCFLDSCRLLVLNLFQFVKFPFTDKARFDYVDFYKFSQIAQRLMDDIVDLELECLDRIIAKIDSDPESEKIKRTERSIWLEIKQKCLDGRRTGTGITALGDTIAALNIGYGTDTSVDVVDSIMKTFKFGCYRSSVDMAKELGAFPVWDKELEKDNPFLNRIKNETCLFAYPGEGKDSIELSDFCSFSIPGKEIWKDMQKFGRRNIALLTIAPVGTVSMLMSLINPDAFTVISKKPTEVEIEFNRLYNQLKFYGTSSGIEPVFMLSYKRRKKITHNDPHARVDFIDQSGDKWQEFNVYHPAVKLWMHVTGKSDIKESPWYNYTAEEIDWKQRVKLQGVANRHIDHSISSTINLPETVTEEEVASIYEEAWRQGCKGITVYRKNCRTGVLVDQDSKEKENINHNHAPKRPVELPCDIYHVKALGTEYFVIVGLLNGSPYEIFAGKNGHISKEAKTGILTKVGNSKYKLHCKETDEIVDSVSEYIENDEEAICRILSTALRHGANVQFLKLQVEKTKGNLTGFAKSVGRILKKYIPDGTKVKGKCVQCGSDNLVFEEGCQICKNCSNSKCG